MSMFSGSHWTPTELKEMLKKLEEMYASGIRDSAFKDQRLVFVTTEDLLRRIRDLRGALADRGEEGYAATGTKKVVRITTRNKGFD